MDVLIIDGANVIGSRPDGWWRDRPGAARSLPQKLATADRERIEAVGACATGPMWLLDQL